MFQFLRDFSAALQAKGKNRKQQNPQKEKYPVFICGDNMVTAENASCRNWDIQMIHKKYIENRRKEKTEPGKQKRRADQNKTGNQMPTGIFCYISYGAKAKTEKKCQHKFIVRLPI